MFLDLVQLTKDLAEKSVSLQDGGYLEPEIKILYDEFLEMESPPPKIQRYLSQFKEFNFLEFFKVYVESSTGFEVKLSYTPDDWLEIRKV